MLRALAEGRVRWGFWPPGSDPHRDGCGLWLEEWSEGTDSESDYELKAPREQSRLREHSDAEGGDEAEEDEGSSEDETEFTKANRAGFFAALSPDEGDDDDDDDEGEDE